MSRPIFLLMLLFALGAFATYRGALVMGEVCTPHNIAARASHSAPRQRKAVTDQQQTGRAVTDAGDWAHEFWCKATATDYAIAFFTYCLVIVGAFTMWRTEQVMRDSERAHFFPDLRPLGVPPTVQINLTIKNNGRASGIQRAVFGDFSQKKPWGILPYHGGQYLTYDQIVDGGAESPAIAGFTSLIIGPQFFFGYIDYLDFFQKRHRTYFCVRVTPGVSLTWADNSLRGRWLNRFH